MTSISWDMFAYMSHEKDAMLIINSADLVQRPHNDLFGLNLQCYVCTSVHFIQLTSDFYLVKQFRNFL